MLVDSKILNGLGPRMLVPEPLEVIVGLECGMAVLRGADVFAPGLC